MKKEFKLKSRGTYNPLDTKPFKISRSGIELFVECPKCFYLNNRLGVRRPSGPPFNINKAVDTLLKKEFDAYREKQAPHPIMLKHKLGTLPFKHDKLDEWRENFKGVRFHHEPTNLLITGAVDDVWINRKGELIVVDYKATSKNEEVNLEAEWQDGYKRQMEIYQWLLRRLSFKVSSTGYFLYCNGKTDADGFNGRIEFDISLLPYKGDDSWVESKIGELKECLDQNTTPLASQYCEFCGYADARNQLETRKTKTKTN